MTRSLAPLLLLLATAIPARADIPTKGPHEWYGKHEASAHLGFTVGATSGTPGGMRLGVDYGYRLTELVWLSAGFNSILGFGSGTCYGPDHNRYPCGGVAGSGYGFEPQIGVKLKFKTSLPLVPYARGAAVFSGVVGRFCGDDGFAVGLRLGGGAKYFLTPRIGVGLEVNTMLGPAFYNGHVDCESRPVAHTDFHASFDFAAGAEFSF